MGLSNERIAIWLNDQFASHPARSLLVMAALFVIGYLIAFACMFGLGQLNWI